MFTAIMNVQGNRVAKYMDFDTEAEALQHVANNVATWPNAIVVETLNDVIANWWVENQIVTVVPIVPPTSNQIDTDTLNATLIGEGSVVRALGLIMFEEINKLRQNAGLAQYTLTQFKNALVTKMRDA